MTEFRVYTPEGASMDLEMLIATFERRSEKAKITHVALQRARKGTDFDLDVAAEIAIQVGIEIAFRQSADLLKAVKKELVAKSAA